MGFIQENIITLDIGLNKEYCFIHFSDVHAIIPESDEGLKLEEAWYKVRVDFAHHFNEKCLEEHMIPSKECLEKLIQYSNNNEPDCVMMTGDIIDFYSDENFKYLKNSLLKLRCKYSFACGNHESPSYLYNDLCRGNTEINYIDFDEFILVSLDNSLKHFTVKQIEIIKDLLLRNRPIILAMHIPIITEYNKEEMSMFDSYFVIDYRVCDNVTLSFINMVVNSENIKAIFCGHVHGANVANFGLNKPQYCASSGLIGYVNKVLIK